MTQTSRLVIEISTENAKRNAELINQELQRMTQRGDDAAGSVDRLGSQSGKTAKELDGATKAARQLVGILGGMAALSKGIKMADAYGQYASRIREATTSAAEYDLVQKRIAETANGTYRSVQEAQEIYLSTSRTLKNLGYDTKQSLDIVDSFSYSLVRNAASADKGQSALNGLTKSLVSNKVSVDSWMSIVSAMPTIIDDLAKSLGKTPKEIQEMGISGQIAGKQLAEAFISSRDANEQFAATMKTSVGDSVQKVANEIYILIGKMDGAYDVTGALSGSISTLGENLDVVVKVGAIAASLYGGKLVAAYTASTVAAIAQQRAVLGSAGAMATASASARALYLALGGPVGLAVGLAGVATSMYLMRDTSKAATVEIDRQGKSVAVLAEEYKKLSLAQAVSEDSNLRKEIESQGVAAKQAAANMTTYINIKETLFQIPTRDAIELIDAIKSVGTDADKAAIALKNMIESGKYDQATIDRFADFVNKLKDSKDKADSAKAAQDALKGVTNNLTTATNSSTTAFDAQGNAIRGAAGAVSDLRDEMQKYIAQTKQGIFANTMQLQLRQKGFSPEQSKALTDARLAKGSKLTGNEANLALAMAASNNALAKSNEAIANSKKAATKTESEAQKDAKQALTEQNRLLEQQADLRKSISTMYASTLEQNRFSYSRAKTDILGAGFSEKDQVKYLELARQFYQKIDDEYLKSLNLELNEFKWSEQQKLDYAYKMDQSILKNRTDLLDDEKTIRMAALDAAYAHQSGQIELQAKQELLSARQSYMSQADYLRERYALEREEIEQTIGKSDELKQKLIEASKVREFQERQAIEAAAFGTFSGAFQLNAFDQMQNQMDAELAQQASFLDGSLEQYEQYQIAKAVITERYMQQERDMQLSLASGLLGQASSTWSSMTSIVKDAAGEQSGIYKTMFAIQQAMAIGQAMINAYQAYGNALATLPPPVNVPIANTMLALGMANVGMIAGQTIAGMAHNGIDNIPREGTWLLDGGERVLNPQQNRDLTGYLQDRKLGNSDQQPKVIINNYSDQPAQASTDANGDLIVTIGKMIDNAVDQGIARNMRQGYPLGNKLNGR